MNEEEIRIIQGAESSPEVVETAVEATETVTEPVTEVVKEPEAPTPTEEENLSAHEARKRILEFKREKQESRRQEVEEIDYDAIKEQLRQEILNEVQEKLNEGEQLKEQIRRLEDERIYDEFNKELNRNVDDYYTRNPHTKDIVSKDFLLKHYEVNPQLIDKPFDEVVQYVYKDLVSAPRMDGYTNSGKNKPKDIDFANPTLEDLQRIENDPALNERYSKFIQSHM